MRTKIKADTLSVIFKDSNSVRCYIQIDDKSTNVSLRFDKGIKAMICGYPQTWNIHDEPVEMYNSESPTYAELVQADGVRDDGQLYISPEIEHNILVKMKISVAKQFKSKDWSQTCPKPRQRIILNKIDRAIKALE